MEISVEAAVVAVLAELCGIFTIKGQHWRLLTAEKMFRLTPDRLSPEFS